MIDFENLKKIDLRVGKIIEVYPLDNKGYITHKVVVDFAQIGTKVSLVNLNDYSVDQLQGKLVIGVVNLPLKNIAGEISEVLLLGIPDRDGECILISPDSERAVIGERVY